MAIEKYILLIPNMFVRLILRSLPFLVFHQNYCCCFVFLQLQVSNCSWKDLSNKINARWRITDHLRKIKKRIEKGPRYYKLIPHHNSSHLWCTLKVYSAASMGSIFGMSPRNSSEEPIGLAGTTHNFKTLYIYLELFWKNVAGHMMLWLTMSQFDKISR